MLGSGNRAAYSGLVREALKKLASPIDWLIARFLTSPVHSSDIPKSDQPIILVVGPPRSGSTLTYQILARYLNVTYPDNLNSLFPKSSQFAMKWFSRRTPKSRALIKSCYGQTCRLSGPNEGFHIWDQWLGADRYQTVDSLPAETSIKMRTFLSQWTHEANKPFVNKNNRSTACIELLSRELKNSYFVLIQRDERDIIRSVIRGREFVQGDKHRPWGLYSQDTLGKQDPLGYVDDVCKQVRKIFQRIKNQIDVVESKRVICVPYSDLCNDPHEVLRKIAAEIPGLELRDELIASELKPFVISTGKLLSDEEEVRMNECLRTP